MVTRSAFLTVQLLSSRCAANAVVRPLPIHLVRPLAPRATSRLGWTLVGPHAVAIWYPSLHGQGLISVADPRGSWGAKWLHLRAFVPGCYALSVHGEPPQHIEDTIEANGRKVMQNVG